MIGEILQELRKDKSMEQADLAKMFGVSRSTISSYELERSEPPIEILCKYARYFNVTIDYLCGLTRDRPNSYHVGIEFSLEDGTAYPLYEIVKDLQYLSSSKQSHVLHSIKFLAQLERLEKATRPLANKYQVDNPSQAE